MKTLAEIKLEVYEEYDVQHECDMYEHVIDEIAKRYATEYAKKALRLAIENVNIKVVGAGYIVLDKKSILSETNLPKHR